MAQDARSRYTKMVIRSSFIQLLEEKPFHQITLKEVCELAGINRSTFYRYYTDIYDWREQIEKECLDHARDVVDQIDSTDLKTLLVHILSDIQKDNDLYRVLFLRQNNFRILEQYLAMCLEKTENLLKEKVLNVSDIQCRWASHYGACGTMGIIQCWIGDGLRQPLEEVADYIVYILTKTIG